MYIHNLQLWLDICLMACITLRTLRHRRPDAPAKVAARN